MDPYTYPLKLRVTYGEGENEEEVFDARMIFATSEGREQTTAVIAALLLQGAEVATVANQEGEVLYHNDRTANDALPLVAREVN